MTKTAGILGWFTCAAALLCGCPDNVPLPPFDATGGFGGEFEATTSYAPDDLLTCRIAFDLHHNPDTFFPLSFKVDGTVGLGFTCASTLNALGELDMPALLGIEVDGALVEDGSISLIGAVDRNGRTFGIVVDGLGLDEDGDGRMDAIDGTFTLAIFDQGSSSLELVKLEGVFSAAAPA